MVRRYVVAVAALAGGCGLFPNLGSLSGGDAGADVVMKSCGVHTFCDDFDDDLLGATWDGIESSSGPLVYSTLNVTPPNSLQATAVPSGGVTALTKAIVAGDHVHIGFDLMVQPASDTTLTQVDIITLQMNVPPAGYAFADFGLARIGDGTVLQQYETPLDGGAPTSQDLPVNEAFATWKHVDLILVFSTQSLVFYVDGAVAATLHVNPTFQQTSTTVKVGAAYVANPKADWNVFIDNFVVDVQ